MPATTQTSKRTISRNTERAVIDNDSKHYLLNGIICLGVSMMFDYIPAHLHGIIYHLQDKGAALAFIGLAIVFFGLGLVKARRARLAGK